MPPVVPNYRKLALAQILPPMPKKRSAIKKSKQWDTDVTSYILLPYWKILGSQISRQGRSPLKYLQSLLEHNARYPLRDHYSVWSVTGPARLADRRFVVYHAYTNAGTLEQIEYLRSQLEDRGEACLVVRDALWGSPTSTRLHDIKQVFIFGAAVDQALVLASPYDFADSSCFKPLD
jgi:hypothetical protein